MRAELLPAADAGALGPAWRELERGALEPNPFFAPEMLQPAVRHLAGRHEIRLWTVHDGADMVFLAPLVLTPAPLGLPVPALTGWRHPHCYLGTPLVTSRDPVPACRAALRLLVQQRLPAWVLLPTMVLDGSVAQALEFAAREEGLLLGRAPRGERGFFLRPADGRLPDARMSHGSRRRLRRDREGLLKALGDAGTRDVACADVGEHLERFLRLESSGWKGRRGTALASDPAHVAFFLEACRGFADQGRLRLFDLGGPSRSAAMMVSLIAGDGLFDFKIAYDERLADCHPGTLLMMDAARLFMRDASLSWWDSCSDPDNDWARRVQPDRRLVGRLFVATGGPRGRAAVRLAPPWTAAARSAWRRRRAARTALERLIMTARQRDEA